MKFFTRQWWGSRSADDKVWRRYHEYFQSIKATLPAPLRTLEEKYTLHDAKIRGISFRESRNSLSIDIAGWDRPLMHPVRYNLEFIGVSSFSVNFPHKYCKEPNFEDLGYWEIEKISKVIEFRAIFSSDAEMRIHFKDFKFTARKA